ncbi:MAG: CNNM domain-containing protein [Plesiomonas sp.]|uniref:CNNM domain-containing protein n=2 Tax=Plesiomonas sp. TaxID=2486279 RepID=UPI003F33D776
MNDIHTGTLFVVLILMLLISAYFSGSETSMMSLNRYRLRHMAKEGHRGAKRAEQLLQRPERLLSLILIGNNLVNILASAIATILGMRLFGDAGVAVATGVLTLVVLIFSEVMPKTIAALYPEKIAFPSTFLLSLLLKVMMPIVLLTNLITSGLMRLFGLRSDVKNEASVSKEELRTIVYEAGPRITRRNQDMLLSIFDLEQITVEDIMVPRNEVVGIDINDDWKSIVRQLNHAQHARLVLYRDTFDNAIGMLRVREAYRLMMEKNEFNKETLLRATDEIYFVPEGTPLNVQLIKFQRNKQRFGLVVDEYGDIQGLITLEDILEEIVGEFTTSMSPTLADETTPQSDGTIYVDGSANIRDLNKAFGWDFPTTGPRTMNGLLLEHLEDIPELGTSVHLYGNQIDILAVSDNMIKQVRIHPKTTATH